MNVSTLVSAQDKTPFASGKRRRRGERRSCIGSSSTRAGCDWQNAYVVIWLRAMRRTSTHAERVVTAKTVEVDDLRFSDKDLDVVGTLAHGQFGTVSPAIKFTGDQFGHSNCSSIISNKETARARLPEHILVYFRGRVLCGCLHICGCSAHW